MVKADTIINFWLDAGPESWFKKDDEFDQLILRNFGKLHEEAAAGELNDWQDTPNGAMALVLILDQFSRNMFRDDARAFAQDVLGLKIAKSSIEQGFDMQVDPSVLQFFYMPLMHSESIIDQRRCVRLFHKAHRPDNLRFAILHRDIINRFGQFPHRNKVLGRPTSPVEREFLESGGFSG